MVTVTLISFMVAGKTALIFRFARILPMPRALAGNPRWREYSSLSKSEISTRIQNHVSQTSFKIVTMGFRKKKSQFFHRKIGPAFFHWKAVI